MKFSVELLLLLIIPLVSASAYDTVVSRAAVKYCGAAYCLPSELVRWTCQACRDQPGVYTANPFVAASVVGPKYYTFGYTAYNVQDRQLVVAFRGSNGFPSKSNLLEPTLNWATNFNWALKDFAKCDGCLVHNGFINAVTSVRNQYLDAIRVMLAALPQQVDQILVTGHSLGAALATLAAEDIVTTFGADIQGIEVLLYNFGGPRVGNARFAQYMRQIVPNSFRVVHDADPVPMMPLVAVAPKYHHIGTEILYEKDSLVYRVCDGSGEDGACFVALPLDYEAAFSMHRNYLQLPVAFYCDNGDESGGSGDGGGSGERGHLARQCDAPTPDDVPSGVTRTESMMCKDGKIDDDGNCFDCAQSNEYSVRAFFGERCDQTCPTHCGARGCLHDGSCFECPGGLSSDGRDYYRLFYKSQCTGSAPLNCDHLGVRFNGDCDDCASGHSITGERYFKIRACWGATCQNYCPANCDERGCQLNGNCYACASGPNVLGTRCYKRAFWGATCDFACPNNCDNRGCRPSDGSCISVVNEDRLRDVSEGTAFDGCPFLANGNADEENSMSSPGSPLPEAIKCVFLLVFCFILAQSI